MWYYLRSMTWTLRHYAVVGALPAVESNQHEKDCHVCGQLFFSPPPPFFVTLLHK